MDQTDDDGLFGVFDFGLGEEAEARARRLHRDCIIVDMVHQGAGSWRLFERPEFAEGEARLARRFSDPLQFMAEALRASFSVDLAGGDILRRWWRASGVSAGYLYVDVAHPGEEGSAALAQVGREVLDALDWLRPALTAEDVRRAKRDGAHALVGYCQPVFGLPTELNALDKAYANGLRVLMLTYNRADAVGSGCKAEVDGGLTEYGEQVVAWSNNAGVIVDTSHCGELTTLAACRRSRMPVLANHASAAGVFAHARGKSDESLKAIADTGGLVGVVCVPYFLTGRRDASIDDMLDHVDYIARLVGWRHVGIGTDWPLTGPKAGIVANFGAAGLAQIGFDQQQDQIDAERNLIGFDDYRDFPNITRGLVSRGYDDEQIRGILGENFLRVFEQVCGSGR